MQPLWNTCYVTGTLIRAVHKEPTVLWGNIHKYLLCWLNLTRTVIVLPAFCLLPLPPVIEVCTQCLSELRGGRQLCSPRHHQRSEAHLVLFVGWTREPIQLKVMQANSWMINRRPLPKKKIIITRKQAGIRHWSHNDVGIWYQVDAILFRNFCHPECW